MDFFFFFLTKKVTFISSFTLPWSFWWSCLGYWTRVGMSEDGRERPSVSSHSGLSFYQLKRGTSQLWAWV